MPTLWYVLITIHIFVTRVDLVDTYYIGSSNLPR